MIGPARSPPVGACARRAFEILHRTGRERMVVSGPNHPTVGAFAILNQEKKEVIIIAYNHNIPNNPIKTETVTITVSGVRPPLHTIIPSPLFMPPLSPS